MDNKKTKVESANYKLRHQRSEATIKKLKDSAVKLINERGYNGVTIDDICDDCGYSKGAFYHHFRSKIDIVSALEADVNRRIEKELHKRKLKDVTDKLKLVNKIMVTGAVENGLEILRERCIYNLSGEYVNDFNTESFAIRSRGIIQELLTDAVNEGQLRKDTPVDDILELILTLFTGTLCQWPIFNGEYDIESRSEQLYDLAITAIIDKYRA